jgi:hypothetical protein
MGKRRTLRERATDWVETVTPHEMASAESFAIAAYEAGARSTRISAAQRRVVEAAVAMVGAAVVWRTNVVSIKSPYGRLINAVDALERAKGDRK